MVEKDAANSNRFGRTSRSPLVDGAAAPAIALRAGRGSTWILQDFRGRAVVLVFYPADWEPVSADQLRRYNDVLPEIRSFGAELVAVSVDSIWCHQAFRRELGLEFNLLSDFHPKGAVARAYRVYRPRFGTSSRALFVVEKGGTIWWQYVGSPEVNPGADGILTALERLPRAPLP